MILAQREKENNKVATNLVDNPNVFDARQVDLDLLRASFEKDVQKTFSVAAHEIRNPLSAMELHSRVILKRIELGEADVAKTSAECIIRSLEVLKGIADGLSSYSKGVEISTHNANISTGVLSAVEIIKPSFEEKGVSLNFKGKNYICEFDFNKTHQIITNLLKNALEATESGGNVDIWIEKDSENIYVFVKDTGCGISKRNQERIFYPNFTTKQTGSGIGLCESKRIAQAQKGNVELLESDNKGSLFALKLAV